MTLTKASIIETVSAKNGWTVKQSSEYVDLLLEIMKSSLASGEDLLISGFGKFSAKEKHERKGRNPTTGDDLILRPRKVVTFKSSGQLRDQINGNGYLQTMREMSSEQSTTTIFPFPIDLFTPLIRLMDK